MCCSSYKLERIQTLKAAASTSRSAKSCQPSPPSRGFAQVTTTTLDNITFPAAQLSPAQRSPAWCTPGAGRPRLRHHLRHRLHPPRCHSHPAPHKIFFRPLKYVCQPHPKVFPVRFLPNLAPGIPSAVNVLKLRSASSIDTDSFNTFVNEAQTRCGPKGMQTGSPPRSIS